MTTAMMQESVSPALRKSCHFCRNRKIRCTGQSICDACQERNLDCIYDPESTKGRPKRKNGQDGSNARMSPDRFSRQSNSLVGDGGRSTKGGGSRARAPSSSQWTSTSNESEPEPKTSGIRGPAIGDDLNQMFNEMFVNQTGAASNIFQSAVAAAEERAKRDGGSSVDENSTSASGSSPGEGNDNPQRIGYEGLLSFLTREIIEMITLRFGNLGCETKDGAPRRFFVTSLARDQSQEMFDLVRPGDNPLKAYSMHRILQLVDLWFSVHPLSPVVSKTLLLSSLKNDTYDEALLAVILADACLVHEISKTDPTEGEHLVQHAASRIGKQPVATREISTAQALILMGWREFCAGHARRGTCYVGYACRIVSELHKPLNQGVSGSRTKLNGVDVRLVEGELIRNIYWVCWATTVWSLMQTDQPFTLLLPEQTPVRFPDLDDSLSATIKLDLASDNVSTLRAQSRSLQELWPLSQVTSTAAYIYALCPTDAEEDRLEADGWQVRHIHQLRRLLNVQLEMPILCRKIRHILVDAVAHVERGVAAGFFQALVLIAYHTIIVHMLFPQCQAPDASIPITMELVDEFCQSAKALIAIAQSLSTSKLTSLPPIPGLKPTTIADAFGLGLDACSRALCYIHSRGTANVGSEERQAINAKIDELAIFAEQLHEISRGELFRGSPTIRAVKKRLKFARKAFQTFNGESFPQLLNEDPPNTIMSAWSRRRQISGSGTTSASGLSQPGSPSADDLSLLPPIPHDASLEMFFQPSTHPHSNSHDPFNMPQQLGPHTSPESNFMAMSSHHDSFMPHQQESEHGCRLSPPGVNPSMFQTSDNLSADKEFSGEQPPPPQQQQHINSQDGNFSHRQVLSQDDNTDFQRQAFAFGHPLDSQGHSHNDFRPMQDYMPMDMNF